jgi:hypothetical protein
MHLGRPLFNAPNLRLKGNIKKLETKMDGAEAPGSKRNIPLEKVA